MTEPLKLKTDGWIVNRLETQIDIKYFYPFVRNVGRADDNRLVGRLGKMLLMR